MALGTNHVTTTLVSAATRTRSNSAFIRELWGDEILAAYKANLVMVPLVVQKDHNGQKGDTIHIPRPTRGSASAKASETQVTLIANQESKSQYLIDQHWEYSRLIEDIVSVQADDIVRQFYTDDAGYALAKKTDTDLHAEGAKFAGADASPTVAGSAYSKAVIGSDGSTAWNGAANTNTGNGTALADAGIREVIRQLDDNDVPSMNRVLVVPPVEKKNLTGISRFTEQAFTGEVAGGNTIRNGLIGDLYGTPVYVSTNSATVQADDASTNYRACLMFSKESIIHISQMSPRTQTQYKLEWLSDLFVADMIYGTGMLRPEGGVAIIVPA